MVALNKLQKAPPYPVEQALKRLGENLRTARIPRGMTVADAEKGKVSTGIVAYTGLLWLYGLLQPFEDLADPLKDQEGLSLQSAKEPTRVRKSGGLNNDF